RPSLLRAKRQANHDYYDVGRIGEKVWVKDPRTTCVMRGKPKVGLSINQ
ncbi:MAG: hypothetical protein ACI8P5_001091, partial [Bacteroidia bacterium]